MINSYQPQLAKIIKIKNENPIIKSFDLKFVQPKMQHDFGFIPGQFIEVGIAGFGEAPFALCSSPTEKNYFSIAVQRIGPLTERLHRCKAGETLWIRGPFGRGFPEIKEKVILIAGGSGLIPFSSLIKQHLAEKTAGQLMLLCGGRQKNDLIFSQRFSVWQRGGLKLHLILEKKEKDWTGPVGLLPDLVSQVLGGADYEAKLTKAIICGPAQMYQSILRSLFNLGFKDENIYLSLERRMHCGIGICQHCAIGSKYICKDGPVFVWSEIKDIAGVI